MKYFGTDGIRKKICEFNEQFLKKIAYALLRICKKFKTNKILIGNDSRTSSNYIFATISSILLSHGIAIDNLGVCSSPCLAYISKTHNYTVAMMISASHNSNEYNGIKFFNNYGEKANDEFEKEFEKLMEISNHKFKTEHACLNNVEHFKKGYINFIKNLNQSNVGCIFDCANGGASKICKEIFTHCEKINCSPNGNNINENSGCLHTDLLSTLCRQKNKIGFAVDGDGDRLCLIDNYGNVHSGDEILYILSKFYLNQHSTLVGTVYTNTALEEILKIQKISLVRSSVGDRNVYQNMLKNNSLLGGENSGHIIVKKYSNTGDGLLVATLLMNILSLKNVSLNDLLSEYKPHYQIMENLSDTAINDEKINAIITELKKQNSRAIIRKSGTENLLRIMVENKDIQTAKQHMNYILNNLK